MLSTCRAMRDVISVLRAQMLTEPTMTLRHLLDQENIIARAGGNILQVYPCEYLSSDKYEILPMDGQCTEEIPIRFQLDHVKLKGYVHPVTNVITEAPRVIDCNLVQEIPVRLGNTTYLYTRNGLLEKLAAIPAALNVFQFNWTNTLEISAPIFQHMVMYNWSTMYSKLTLNDIFQAAENRRQISQLIASSVQGKHTGEAGVQAFANAMVEKGLFGFLTGFDISLPQVWIFGICTYVSIMIILVHCCPIVGMGQLSNLPWKIIKTAWKVWRYLISSCRDMLRSSNVGNPSPSLDRRMQRQLRKQVARDAHKEAKGGNNRHSLPPPSSSRVLRIDQGQNSPTDESYSMIPESSRIQMCSPPLRAAPNYEPAQSAGSSGTQNGEHSRHQQPAPNLGTIKRKHWVNVIKRLPSNTKELGTISGTSLTKHEAENFEETRVVIELEPTLSESLEELRQHCSPKPLVIYPPLANRQSPSPSPKTARKPLSTFSTRRVNIVSTTSLHGDGGNQGGELYTRIFIQQVPFTALIDTGSSLFLVQRSVANQLVGCHWEKTDVYAESASGDPMKIYGRSMVTLGIVGRSIYTPMYAAETLPFPVILGLQTMIDLSGQSKCFTFDLENRELRFEHDVLPLLGQVGNQVDLISVLCAAINGGSELFTRLSIDGRESSALVDSGCPINLASVSVRNKLRNCVWEEPDVSAASASKQDLQLFGRTKVNLALGTGEDMAIQVYGAQRTPYPFVLGLRTMLEMCQDQKVITFDLGNSEIAFGKNVVLPLEIRHHQTAHLMCPVLTGTKVPSQTSSLAAELAAADGLESILSTSKRETEQNFGSESTLSRTSPTLAADDQQYQNELSENRQQESPALTNVECLRRAVNENQEMRMEVKDERCLDCPLRLKSVSWPIAVDRTVVLPPQSENQIALRSLILPPIGAMMLFEPDEVVMANLQLLILRTVVEPQEGRFTAKVLNVTDKAVQLPARCNVGSAMMVEKILWAQEILGSEQCKQHNAIQPPQSEERDETIMDDESRSGMLQHPELVLKRYSLDQIDLDQADLSEDQKTVIQLLVRRNAKAFSQHEFDIGNCDVIKHTINTGAARPVRQKPYRIPFAKRTFVEQNVEQMLKADIIEPSTSPWASPVVLAMKKDKTLRFCIDLRKVNEVTMEESQILLPHMTECLALLAKAKFFTSVDVMSSFWQLQLDPVTAEKTAFITHVGLFQFKRLPMGLKFSTNTFQRVLEYVLAGINGVHSLSYVDDVLIFSETFEAHVGHVNDVLERFLKYGIKLKPSKCKFARSSVPFLGHIISKAGVAVDPDKISAVQIMKVPTTLTEIRSFLGFVGYYRRFILNFSKLVSPITDLLKKRVPLIWSEACQRAFDDTRLRLITAPILAYPNFDLPFLLQTDASTKGVAAILSQADQSKVERPVAMVSRTLAPAEKNYSINDLELLAVHFGFKKLKQYLDGKRWSLITDNAAVSWILRSKADDVSGRVARWRDELQGQNMTAVFRPGNKNNADALSRLTPEVGVAPPNAINCPVLDDLTYDAKITPSSSTEPAPHCVTARCSMVQVTPLKDDLRGLQQRDNHLREIITFLKSENKRADFSKADCERLERMAPSFCMIEDLLYHISQVHGEFYEVLTVPQSMHNTMLRSVHDDVLGGHVGQSKVYEKLRERYWWSGMKADVDAWVKKCQVCRERKDSPKPVTVPLVPIYSDTAHDRWVVDFVGKLPCTERGNEYILAFTDQFTKQVEAFSCKSADARTVAFHLLNDIIARYGVPRVLASDNGSHFVNEVLDEMTKLFDITQRFGLPYRPQTQGLAERVNQTLLSFIGPFVDRHARDWDLYLGSALFAYRTSYHSSTGYTPFFLTYGQTAKLPSDRALSHETNPYLVDVEDYVADMAVALTDAFRRAREISEQARLDYKKYYDRDATESPYNIGDLVYHKKSRLTGSAQGKKLTQFRGLLRGPYVIIDLAEPPLNNLKLQHTINKRDILWAHPNTVRMFKRLTGSTRSVDPALATPLPEPDDPDAPRPSMNMSAEPEADLEDLPIEQPVRPPRATDSASPRRIELRNRTVLCPPPRLNQILTTSIHPSVSSSTAINERCASEEALADLIDGVEFRSELQKRKRAVTGLRESAIGIEDDVEDELREVVKLEELWEGNQVGLFSKGTTMYYRCHSEQASRPQLVKGTTAFQLKAAYSYVLVPGSYTPIATDLNILVPEGMMALVTPAKHLLNNGLIMHTFSIFPGDCETINLHVTSKAIEPIYIGGQDPCARISLHTLNPVCAVNMLDMESADIESEDEDAC